ncbi:MAG: ribonuclease III [Spirochaetaceae bacterium]|nr:MAG: ribonuclease III [Spirochaetaceae bacterium]
MLFGKNYADLMPPAVSSERRKELQLFEKHAGIKFRSPELLNLAFSHRSYANENQYEVGNNEKLEFLGDSVLGLVVAEYLFETLTEKAEGDLAKIKSFVVSEDSLAAISRSLKVDNFILIGKGEEYSGGRSKKALLADALEAIIGAFFLDSGFRASKKFILKYLVPEINKVLQNRHRKDYKTLLQELVQKQFKTYPKYTMVKKTGPDHSKTFWMEVKVGETTYGPGKGRNKKSAEQSAAQLAYTALSGDQELTDSAGSSMAP